ncbi:MAG TPA: MASE1 domain-containing protein, partial [Holophagaceae bacterium]|nr:MASE1 domain-containing protein [Holophagaceae bacterium]
MIASILGKKPVQVALVAAAYFALARLGLSLAFATTQVTAVWPPAGLALAALVLAGPWAALGVFAGAFAANAMAHESWSVAAGIASGNTLAGLAGWWLLKRIGNPDPDFSETPQVLVLAMIAVTAPLLSASGGVACLRLGGLMPASALGSVWRLWWVGDCLGTLLVTPLILTWRTPPKPDWRSWKTSEAGLLSLIVVATGVLVFCGAFEKSGIYFRAYAVFPLLIWAALRFGSRATVATAVGISAFAVWGTIHGRGPFGLSAPDQGLLNLDAFIGVTGITSLILGAATTERREAERRLSAAHGELERKVEARTAELASANEDLGRKHEEIEASRRFLETVVGHLPVALVVKSAKEADFGTVQLWNPAAERIFGTRREQVIGRTAADFLEPDEGARVMSTDKEVASNGWLK